VIAMRADRIQLSALCVVSALLLPACENVIVGTPGARTVPLRFSGTPADATVTIDDQRAGSMQLVSMRGVRVLPGKHHVSVEAQGYVPYDAVIVAKDDVVRIDARLVPVPD
jgi:PEGA domain